MIVGVLSRGVVEMQEIVMAVSHQSLGRDLLHRKIVDGSYESGYYICGTLVRYIRLKNGLYGDHVFCRRHRGRVVGCTLDKAIDAAYAAGLFVWE